MTEEESKWIKTNDSVCALLKQAHDVLAMSSLPPRRKWVGLTDEEVYEVYGSVQKEVNEHWEGGGTTMMFPTTLYKAIEAKLKEKNSA